MYLLHKNQNQRNKLCFSCLTFFLPYCIASPQDFLFLRCKLLYANCVGFRGKYKIKLKFLTKTVRKSRNFLSTVKLILTHLLPSKLFPHFMVCA